jgi:quercetin dioxygenase-like cupin family protein
VTAVRRWLEAAVLVALTAHTVPAQTSAPLHTRCDPGERGPEFGCSVLAQLWVPSLPEAPLFWYIDAYPSRLEAQADAAGSETSVVVTAHDQVWLLTVAPRDWRGDARRRVATVGPLPVPLARSYRLMFLEGVFPPGVTIFTHKHSGPEAWYVLDGAQCVETPGGVLRTGAGEGMVVPPDVPMSLRAVGTSPRRVLTLFVHDAHRPATVPVDDWKPTGLCER